MARKRFSTAASAFVLSVLLSLSGVANPAFPQDPTDSASSVPAPTGAFAYGRASNRLFTEEKKSNLLVVIWNNGILVEGEWDNCRPGSPRNNYPAPRVLSRLHGQKLSNRRVLIYELCSYYSNEDWHSQERWRKRETAILRSLAETLEGFIAQGIPAENLVLAGHSIGAWLSILAVERFPTIATKAIAFAPGYLPRWRERSPYWWQDWWRMQAELGRSESLDVLLYLVAEDEWDRPRDFALLRRVKDVDTIEVSAKQIAGERCGLEILPGSSPHDLPYFDCFTNSQWQKIEHFLAPSSR